MKTRVVITVDTEPSVAGAFADPERNRPRLHEPVWGEVAGRSEALGFIIRTLAPHDLIASFFVETVHVGHFGAAPMGRYVERLCDAGQDVQLHLHPCWTSLRENRECSGSAANDYCGTMTYDEVCELTSAGRAQIETWTGLAPNSLRTGNFSVSKDVYRAMETCGLRASSNVCVAVAPPEDRELAFVGGAHLIDGVLELPVTCFRDRGPVGRGRPRPLQITACRFEEIRAILRALHHAGGSIAVIATHPFEFLKWSGPGFERLRANRMVQRRFERLCHFLATNEDTFEVVPISRLAVDGPDHEPEIRLDGQMFSATRRAIENFVNDRVSIGMATTETAPAGR